MGLRENCYAKIWCARPYKSIYKVNMSVSRKMDDGTYENTFSGWVTFGRDAAKKIEKLCLPEKIDKNNPVYTSVHITSSPDISSYFNKQKMDRLLSLADGKEELVNFIKQHSNALSVTIWDFELASGSPQEAKSVSQTTKKTKPSTKKVEVVCEDEDDDDLPF